MVEKHDYDDSHVVGLSKHDTFVRMNDGINVDVGKDVLVIDFPLQIRLTHKAILECLLPRVGSSTSLTKEDAQTINAIKDNKVIDVAEMIIRYMMNNCSIKPSVSILMKLFKFKKIRILKNSLYPVPLKKISNIISTDRNLCKEKTVGFP